MPNYFVHMNLSPFKFCGLLVLLSLLFCQFIYAQDSNPKEQFPRKTIFLGSGALLGNHLSSSEEVLSLNLSVQTGFFARKNLFLGTDLRVRADYLFASKKFAVETFGYESIWLSRYYFGNFFPQMQFSIGKDLAVRTGIGLGYHFRLAPNVGLVPVFNRISPNYNRKPGPVRTVYDQPVPSSEFQLGLVYVFKK